ncbi:MAG: hypothetical protein PHE67_00830 [Campylobacterales bacterium]|nr:hypothetical protein [Campylobacterales bacterium]
MLQDNGIMVSALFADIHLSKEELVEAIKLATSFCKKYFGEYESINNSRDLSVFCASVLHISTHKKFNRKEGNNASENFNVSSDYYNELKLYCRDCPPLPLKVRLESISQKKDYNHEFVAYEGTDFGPIPIDCEQYSKYIIHELDWVTNLGKEIDSNFTDFEKEVLILVADGMTNNAIAKQFGMSKTAFAEPMELLQRKLYALKKL